MVCVCTTPHWNLNLPTLKFSSLSLSAAAASSLHIRRRFAGPTSLTKAPSAVFCWELLKMLRCSDLPEDVVVKILCRLPIKSLIQFTCVCTRWRSIIISDPQFAESHLQLALQKGTLGRRVLVSGYYFDDNMLRLPYGDLPTRFQSFKDDSSVITLTYPTEENRYPRIVGSCNGLVLLAEAAISDCRTLYIWNPTTRFSRKIPHLPKGDQDYISFGHVSATDDYKVVLIPPYGSSGHVYSLSEKIWKDVEVPSWLSLNSWTSSVGTISNGVIHWVNYFTPELSERVIYGFDLAKEEFGKVPLPDWIHSEYDMITIRTQVNLGGCLCISSEDAYGHIEYWVMTEYGLPASWVKLFQFSLSDLPKVSPGMHYSCNSIYVTEGGTVLLRIAEKMEFFRIECSKEKKPVCSGRYRLEEEVHGCDYIYHATVYDETLVRIPE